MKITRHFGTYGRQYTVDEDGNEVEIKIVKQKRSKRGRPRKNEISEGSCFIFTKELLNLYYAWCPLPHVKQHNA